MNDYLECDICDNIFLKKKSGTKKYCLKCSKILNSFEGRERTRQYVRMKADNRCQKCKKRWKKNTRRLDVHHLDGQCGIMTFSYDGIRSKVGLVALCHKCHIGLHLNRNKMKKGIRRILTPEKENEVISLHSQKLSLRVIAKKVNLAYPTVQKLITKRLSTCIVDSSNQ